MRSRPLIKSRTGRAWLRILQWCPKVRFRYLAPEHVIDLASWRWHRCYLPPHPLYRFHNWCLRVRGLEMRIILKARDWPWNGPSHVVLYRLNVPSIPDALDPEITTELDPDDEGNVYVLAMTAQYDVVRYPGKPESLVLSADPDPPAAGVRFSDICPHSLVPVKTREELRSLLGNRRKVVRFFAENVGGLEGLAVRRDGKRYWEMGQPLGDAILR
jgi:hypothetical protein